MTTTSISIKTTKEKKEKAFEVSNALGEKRSTYGVYDEEPSPYLKRILKQSEKNRKAGKGSPIFDNAKDAIAWLHR